jgi:SAM-dependent methyltransferase
VSSPTRVEAVESGAAPCPLCGVPPGAPRYAKAGSLIYHCPRCDILFVGGAAEPVRDPTAEYGEQYYSWLDDNPSLARHIKRATFGAWLQLIEQHVAPGKLLDVGCAFGFLLEEARARGWQAHGVEISDYARRVAAEGNASAVVVKDLAALAAHRGSFRVVTCFDVIEHLYDLGTTLRAVHELLSDDGFLALCTPNVRSLSARLMGRFWFHVKPREHPLLLSPPALQGLLADVGFTVLDIRRAWKRMTLGYVAGHFAVYRYPLNGVVSPAIHALPRAWQDFTFPLYSGEMFVLARKSTGAPAAAAR